jgi:hypothetical protein
VKVSHHYRALDTTSRDKLVAKTTTAIIAALHDEGHQGPLEQGFIGNRLHGTDVSEFIHVRYGSLVKFLQDGTCRDDFVVTIDNKGTCFIDHAPKLVLSKPVRVSPTDSIPLESDSAVLMRLTDFRAMLPLYRDPTVGMSFGARGYGTSRSVKRHGSQKQGSTPVVGDKTHPSELPQENQDVLKKLREMKLGAHIDHAHSISIGRLGEQYNLMIVIDVIDFVWSQT